MRRAALFIAVAALWGGATARDALDHWVNTTDLPPLVAETSTEVLDRNGDLLRAYTVSDGRWRLQASLDSVDPTYLDMVVAYEDKRFYRHNGVDPIAVARAIAQAIRHGKVVSGASTLTMQVARLLEDGPTGRWDGKIRQVRLALALERRLSKQDILTLYVNRAPFGGNIEGVRAATYAYFGKPPKRLTPAQSALLVALPQSPEARRPDRAYETAKSARNRVLDRMAGAGVLATGDARAALNEQVPHDRAPFPALAPHLADRAVQDDPLAPIHRLTIDGGLQARLAALMQDAVRPYGDGLSAAMIVADYRNGEVLVTIGSPDFTDDARDGYVDMTRAFRSPGSTLKPLVYGLAFDQGLAHPETLVDDRPVTFAGGYTPQNFDGQFRGELRVRQALQASLNIPVVSLVDAFGPSRLMAHMRRAGMSPDLPVGGAAGLAVALGGVGVTLEDLTQLYAAIGNGGRPVALTWRMDARTAAGGPRVLSERSAWYVADILRGTPRPLMAPQNGLAFKTGTSYGHRDAWAAGFDGRHVIAVWMGRPDGTPVPGVFGGDVAAPLLFDAFGHLKDTLDPLPAPPRDALLVGNAELPLPLQRFRPRDAVFAPSADGVKLIFPPDGARVDLGGAGLVLKLRDGTPPFAVFGNGAPLATSIGQRDLVLAPPTQGFLNLSVVDAGGRTANASIFIE